MVKTGAEGELDEDEGLSDWGSDVEVDGLISHGAVKADVQRC